MPTGLNLAKIRIGEIPVTGLKDQRSIERAMTAAANAIRDMESQLDIIVQLLITTEANPAAGNIKAFFREEGGTYHLYSIVAGAGMTITPDTSAKTLTLTSP